MRSPNPFPDPPFFPAPFPVSPTVSRALSRENVSRSQTPMSIRDRTFPQPFPYRFPGALKETVSPVSPQPGETGNGRRCEQAGGGR